MEIFLLNHFNPFLQGKIDLNIANEYEESLIWGRRTKKIKEWKSYENWEEGRRQDSLPNSKKMALQESKNNWGQE